MDLVALYTGLGDVARRYGLVIAGGRYRAISLWPGAAHYGAG